MGDLIARRLDELAPDAHAAFFAWIEGMTAGQDREDGPAFAAWLREHAAIPGDATWVFYDRATGALLGTASLIRRDRTLLAPVDGWVLGGVNVVAAARGQGVGAAIMRWIDGEVRRRAAAQGRPVRVLLQAENPVAVRLYAGFGYRPMDGIPGVYAAEVGPELRHHEDGALRHNP